MMWFISMVSSPAVPGMTMPEPLKINCRNCHCRLDVSDFEPFTLVECPGCGTHLRVPKPFGRYQLEKVCGTGGTSVIYRAIDPVLARLESDFAAGGFPHEIGVFLGYPLKDVAGFLHREQLRPVCRGDWQVFGNPERSLRLMRRYRFWESFAARIIGECRDLESCLERIAAAPAPAEAAVL